jgi:ankyrin repeat protein
MFKAVRYKYLFGLICLVVPLTSKIAWSSEEICEAARYSNLKEPKYLARFEELVKQQSNLNKIDCDGKNLFAVAYDQTREFSYLADVRESRYDNLIILLEYGYNVNQADVNGYAPLHLAALKGDINVIYLLVEWGAKINAKTKDQKTPLHLAVRYGNKEAVNLLLYLGADPNQRNDDQKNPLDVAIYEAYFPERVEILLQHGTQPSGKTLKYLESEGVILYGGHAQIIALVEKYQELTVRALLKGVQKNQLSFNPPPAPPPQLLPEKESVPLYVATSQNDINEVRKLLSQDVNVDAFSGFGFTSLHTAINYGYEKIAELLIEAGANTSLQDSIGNYPLTLARNSPHLTQLLLEKGALVDQKTSGYLETALMNSKNVQVSKLLLAAGADIHYKSEDGYTALSRAVEDENLLLVKFLLKQGADASETNNHGRKLFLDVAGYNKLEIVKLFLAYITPGEINQAFDQAVLVDNSELEDILKHAGANYSDKETLFDEAVKTQGITVVQRLLNEGMDAYLKTERGSENLITSFLCCFPNKYDVQLTKLLLDNGANANLTTKKVGYQNKIHTTTPLITAMEYWIGESSDLIDLLLKYEADVNYRNTFGETALYKAIAKPLLRDYGYLLTKDGYNLELQKSLDDSLETVKLLLDHGADIHVETENGSIEELVSTLKKSDREYIVDFANEVDLLLELDR